MTDGEIVAAMWAQSDVFVLATGIYMERYRIGWYSARDALRDEADQSGIEVATLADQIVRRLDGRNTPLES